MSSSLSRSQSGKKYTNIWFFFCYGYTQVWQNVVAEGGAERAVCDDIAVALGRNQVCAGAGGWGG